MASGWPYEDDKRIAKSPIDWEAADKSVLMRTPPERWQAVPRDDLKILVTEVKHNVMVLPQKIQQLIMDKVQSTTMAGSAPRVRKTEFTKQEVLSEVDDIHGMALASDDLATALKAATVKAQISALMNAKPKDESFDFAKAVAEAQERLRKAGLL